MIEFVQEIDTQLFLYLNSLNHEVVDPFMKQFSGKIAWVPMYLSIAAVFIWRYGWRRGLMLILAVGAAVGLADLICASVIRPIFQRMRPANPENPISLLVHIVDGYRGGRYGFPSCHAANTMALACATSLMLGSRKYMAFIFLWAMMQCYSRIYLGVHYPGDILVGSIVGVGLGFAAYWLAQKISHAQPNASASTWPIIIVGVVTTAILLIVSLA